MVGVGNKPLLKFTSFEYKNMLDKIKMAIV